jgi:mRNA interferase MazF
VDLVKRGDVWLIKLDPTVGSKIQKTRPCLVISPDELNASLRRVIVAPLTTKSQPTSFRLPVTFRQTPGLILFDQIRTVDRKRLVTCMGAIDPTALRAALAILVGMFER